MSRQIYAISYYEKKSGRQRIQVLLSIDGYRIIAQRTGEFEGVETFWCGEDGIWKDVWLEKKNPRASKVIVYKKGANKGISAVALFEEYANMDSPIWKKMPALMIAKCAESIDAMRFCSTGGGNSKTKFEKSFLFKIGAALPLTIDLILLLL